MSEDASERGGVAVGGGAVADKVPLLEVRDVAKYFGSVNALQGISLKVYPGEVTCVLGDNGAGKSTLIKILSGVFQPDAGEFLIAGEPVTLAGPREARAAGIATVFQDLATVPLMSLWRNFFLGQEPVVGWGPLRRIDTAKARAIMRDELAKMGIDVRDPNQNVGTLSGGERQALAIARAVYFGARVLILDEPTSALGVRQSGVVLKYIVQARELGKGVIFITHNPHHAYPVGDRFYLLKRGQLMASVLKSETTIKGLTDMMAGGQELEELSRELMGLTGSPDAPGLELAEVARELAEEAPAEPAELSGGEAAVDGQGGAGDEGGFVAEQEGDEGGDLGRAGDPASGVRGGQLVDADLGPDADKPPVQRSVHVASDQRVDPQAPVRALQCGAAGQADHSVLGGHVRSHATDAGHSPDGGVVDNRPARCECRDLRLHAVEDAGQVRGQRLLPGRGVDLG